MYLPNFVSHFQATVCFLQMLGIYPLNQGAMVALAQNKDEKIFPEKNLQNFSISIIDTVHSVL